MRGAPARLGDFLLPKRDEVALSPTETYRIAGVLSFGRGLFERAPILGAETSYESLYRLHRDQVVVSRLNGWEGALAVVDTATDGALVSNEFLTYSIDTTRADIGYVRHLCQWPVLWDALVPRGSMVRRKRVNPTQLAEVEVSLPDLLRQRELASRLDAAAALAGGLLQRQSRAEEVGDALTDALSDAIFRRSVHEAPLAELGEVVELNPRPTRLNPDSEIVFVPMAAVDATTGTITDPSSRRATEVGTGYKQFRRGDVIFARITPCMQNGKAAIYASGTEYAAGSSEFFVLRPGPEVQAGWIHAFVRSRAFRDDAAQRFTGTAGQQRVPASFMKTALIPVPSIERQSELLADFVVQSDQIARLRALRNRGRLLASAIAAAARHETLSSVT